MRVYVDNSDLCGTSGTHRQNPPENRQKRRTTSKNKVVHMWYIFSASPETPLKTGKKGVPLLIFDVLGDAEKDGLPFSRVPVLKIFLCVFPLIYGRKYGQNGALTCGDAKIDIANRQDIRYNVK